MNEIKLVVECSRCGKQVSVLLQPSDWKEKVIVIPDILNEKVGMKYLSFGRFVEVESEDRIVCEECSKAWKDMNDKWNSDWREMRTRFFKEGSIKGQV